MARILALLLFVKFAAERYPGKEHEPHGWLGLRRPSVSRRRGTNMEQFASRSDVFIFPANLQTQTKMNQSHFFLASFPWFPNCYSVCKVSEVLRHFFTLHVISCNVKDVLDETLL